MPGGQRVAGTAADQHDRVPDPGREAPGRAQRGRVLGLDEAGRRRPRPGPRGSWWCAGPATAWPCRSCSSWTVHSTSDRPPGPSLRCRARSVAARDPLGLDARLDPADLPRRLLAEPAGRVAVPVGDRDELRAQRRVADGELGAQQCLPLPRRRRGARSTPRRRRASGPAGPGLPSGRRSASTCSGGSGAGICSSRRSSVPTACAASDARRSPSASSPGSGSCTKMTSASLPNPDSCPP